MNSLSSPTEAILSAAQTVFGRLISYCGACWVGMILPAIPQAILEGELDELISILLQPWLIVPVAFASFFSGFGLLIYPLCLAFAIYFIREELSFKWLLLPMGLIAVDTTLMALRWGIL